MEVVNYKSSGSKSKRYTSSSKVIDCIVQKTKGNELLTQNLFHYHFGSWFYLSLQFFPFLPGFLVIFIIVVVVE
jgi:hypothetical protein